MLNRSKAWALALLAIVLAAGVTAGWTAATWRSGCEARKPHGPEGMVQYLTSELNLTPTQQDSVRAVLARHRPALDSIWREVHPRYEAIRNQVRVEVTAQLGPEQRTRYQRLIAEREHQRKMADSVRAQGQRERD